MGTACSKKDHNAEGSRDDFDFSSKMRAQNSPADRSTAWHERCNIEIESFSTSSKRILSQTKGAINGCKGVVVCRIQLEKKDPATGQIVFASNKKNESKLSCVLRMPSLDWGQLSVKAQFPRLLPLNLWPGEMYVFSFLALDSFTKGYVTLNGKVGKEDVCIRQQITANPNFSLEKWKHIEEVLQEKSADDKKHEQLPRKQAEISKHKLISTKECVQQGVQEKRRESRKKSSRLSKSNNENRQPSIPSDPTLYKTHHKREKQLESTSHEDIDDGGFEEHVTSADKRIKSAPASLATGNDDFTSVEKRVVASAPARRDDVEKKNRPKTKRRLSSRQKKSSFSNDIKVSQEENARPSTTRVTVEHVKWSRDAHDADDESGEELQVLFADSKSRRGSCQGLQVVELSERAVSPTPYSPQNSSKQISLSELTESQHQSDGIASLRKYQLPNIDLTGQSEGVSDSQIHHYQLLHNYSEGIELPCGEITNKETNVNGSEGDLEMPRDESINMESSGNWNEGDLEMQIGKPISAKTDAIEKDGLKDPIYVEEPTFESLVGQASLSQARRRRVTPFEPPSPILKALDAASIRKAIEENVGDPFDHESIKPLAIESEKAPQIRNRLGAFEEDDSEGIQSIQDYNTSEEHIIKAELIEVNSENIQSAQDSNTSEEHVAQKEEKDVLPDIHIDSITKSKYTELDMSNEVITTQNEEGRGTSSESINIEEESRIRSKSFGQSKTKPYSLSKHAMRQHSVDSTSIEIQPKMRGIPSPIKENETPPPVRKAFQEEKKGKDENSGSLRRTSSAKLVKKKAIDDFRATSLGSRRNKLARMSKK